MMSINKTVTFETKCYFNDWEFIVKQNLLSKMIANCNYNFAGRRLFLNNFNDYGLVKKHVDGMIKDNIIDEYYIVSDYAAEAMKFFNINKDDFKGGYYYSIAELVSIYLCDTDYLLHFSGDSVLEKNCTTNWIDDAISIMENDPKIVIANPTWDFNYKEAKKESISEDENWFYSYGFSDQCYLVKTENFKKDIYREFNSASERYPKYGGELFEKRVDSYIRNHELLRITSKHCSYIHRNFPKNSLLKYFRLKFNL
jgi:hypothetical protein